MFKIGQRVTYYGSVARITEIKPCQHKDNRCISAAVDQCPGHIGLDFAEPNCMSYGGELKIYPLPSRFDVHKKRLTSKP